MKTLFVIIDTESFTNVAVGYNIQKLLTKVRNQDVYFYSDEDFDKNYQDRYAIEIWDVEEDNGTI